LRASTSHALQEALGSRVASFAFGTLLKERGHKHVLGVERSRRAPPEHALVVTVTRMAPRQKVIVSWSSGKDSAQALHEVRRAGDVEVVGILTTITSEFGRVSMHGVRETLLDQQAEALGLPCWKVPIPSPCPNEVYEHEMARVLGEVQQLGVMAVVFGDLFLGDIRRYRETKLAEVGMHGVFPLWGRDTTALAQEMIEVGIRAMLTCIDPKKLDRSFAGRSFDAELLRELPFGVDPCGENGEFHTFAWAGPMFGLPVAIEVGELVERDGFVFADVLPAPARSV
jgi:uncharacterized protein (TIGR00290 family)